MKQDLGLSSRGGHFGKYRGVVVNNLDPEHRGRLLVSVDEIGGSAAPNWAMPSVPYAGPDVGLYMIPPVDAHVWVEFEGGMLNHPIWSGCFWLQGQCPESLPTRQMIKTPTASISMDQTGAGLEISVPLGAGDGPANTISVSGGKITIQTPGGAVIELDGPKVTINSGALEIT